MVQLQVLFDMWHEIFLLYTSGHFDYQEGYVQRHPFLTDGLPALQAELARLREEVTRWKAVVTGAREQHYYLNYFTMRELLRIVAMLDAAAAMPRDDQVMHHAAAPKEVPKTMKPPPISWACDACTFENKVTEPVCNICSNPKPHNFERDVHHSISASIRRFSPASELSSLLHLGSSAMSRVAADRAVDAWRFHVSSTANRSNPGVQLNAVGKVLGEVFARPAALSHSTACIRAAGSGCTRHSPARRRRLHRADMLIAVHESDARSLPVWVACAESPSHVIDVVLSVYVRRAQLPEPGEILFCTSATRLEDVELLFWRFVSAKSHGRGDCVFCVADAHALSYTLQTAVVERLREFLADYERNAPARSSSCPDSPDKSFSTP